MKHRYFLQISYKGTNYHGWQVQPGSKSVQEVIENALSTILRDPISVVGAGRTDAGVHALYFILHFDSENDSLHESNLVHKLNSFLPYDIAVQNLFSVKTDAHARFDAISRTYKYFISTNKNPFAKESAYIYTLPLDVKKMNEMASIMFEYQDYTSFSKLHTDVKTNNCKLIHAEWAFEGEMLVFTIKADRFLRNMVRAVVGTLIEGGNGKITSEDFRKIIELKDRGKAGVSAPAQGLFLVNIEYPAEVFNAGDPENYDDFFNQMGSRK